MYTRFWLENVLGRDNLDYVGLHGRIILKWNLNKQGVTMCD
jgi:hypothetical protein